MDSDDYIHFAGDWSEAERATAERAIAEFEEKAADLRPPSEGPRPLVCLKGAPKDETPCFVAYRLGREDMLTALTARDLASKIYRLAAFGSSEEVDETEWRGGIPRARLRKVFDYVRSHLAESIKIPDMAKRAHLSDAHFAREFKSTLGETPLEYLTRCRIEEAKRLLKHGDLKIGEIACRVGLRNASHFAKVFREHVGMTPSQYRLGQLSE
jgi:AraC-like DNA-binding protein